VRNSSRKEGIYWLMSDTEKTPFKQKNRILGLNFTKFLTKYNG
jgi:hypothetical protein